MAMTMREKSLTLKDNHGWKARPGYGILVLDRGAVRLDYPEDWVVSHDPDSMKIHDRQPPDDDCVLAISYGRLAPTIDWTGLPLRGLIDLLMRNDKRNVLERRAVVDEPKRGDLEISWGEMLHLDPNEKREAVSRLAVARAGHIQSMISFDFWADQSELYSPVWPEVLGSIVLGWYVNDPTVGPVVQ